TRETARVSGGPKGLRVAVLHGSSRGSTAPFSELDPPADPARHLPQHTFTDVWVHKMTAARQTAEVAAGEFDVGLNLCGGGWEEDRPGIEVVLTLEREHMAFTGASSQFYEPSRVAMKMAAHAGGVAVPAFVYVQSPREIERILDTLSFPIIVKPPEGYSSIGLHPGSRVSSVTALAAELRRTLADHRRALVEEFIEGRECTVLVTEPDDDNSDQPWPLTPIEYRVPPGEP